MNKSCLPVHLLWFAWLCSLSTITSAQSNSAPLHQYDALMQSLFERKQQDSFLLLAQYKADLAKKADSLDVWAQTQLNMHEAFEDDYGRCAKHLNAVWGQRWRDPATAAEARPFTFVFATLGFYLSKLNQHKRANEMYEIAARFYEKYRFTDFNVANALYKPLGANYIRLGENEKAIAVLHKGLMAGGTNSVLSGFYANIGIAYWNQGDFSAAEVYYRQGLALDSVPDIQRCLLLCRLAETLLDEQKPNQAYAMAINAVKLLPNVEPDDHRALEYRARAYRVAGMACTQLVRYTEAQKLLNAALNDDKMAARQQVSREVGKDLNELARLMILLGRPEQALQISNQALTAVLPNFQPGSLEQQPDVASFYEENTIAEALFVKAEAAEAFYSQNHQTQWLHLAASCYDLADRSENLLRSIFQYTSSKLNLQSKAHAREASALHVLRMLYEQTAQVSLLEKAFQVTERSKSLILSEAFNENLIRSRLAGQDTLFDRLNELRQSLAPIQRDLRLFPDSSATVQWRFKSDSLTAQVNQVSKEISQRYPALEQNTQTTILPTPPEGEAVMVYFVGTDGVHLFIFQKNKSPEWLYSNELSSWKNETNAFLTYFRDANAILNDPNGYLKAAHQLWMRVLPSALRDVPKLTIIPDGFLNYIPFDALVTALPDGAPSLRNARYLLLNQTVRYAWSWAVLQQQEALRPNDDDGLLSVAPRFSQHERGLAPLEAGKEEWSAVNYLGDKHLEGSEATVDNFLRAAPKSNVLHLATHAVAEEPTRIELYDKPMYLPDLYALPLQADLVVLSACQTNLGKEETGEGVMSLARAFAQAGAAAVVSSLWAVNDQSTSRLLNRFYTCLSSGQTTSNALRQAKLDYLANPEVRATAQTPYYWAGFTMLGADKTMYSGYEKYHIWWAAAALLLLAFVWYFKKRKQ